MQQAFLKTEPHYDKIYAETGDYVEEVRCLMELLGDDQPVSPAKPVVEDRRKVNVRW